MDKSAATTGWSPPKDTRFRRRLIYARHLLLSALVMRRGYPLRTFGQKSTGCSWTFCPQGLGRDSVVYSGGVGNDVTFEHELVRAFGCSIYLLDPSPTGRGTHGIAGKTRFLSSTTCRSAWREAAGTLQLAAPIHADEELVLRGGGQPGNAVVEVPCAGPEKPAGTPPSWPCGFVEARHRGGRIPRGVGPDQRIPDPDPPDSRGVSRRHAAGHPPQPDLAGHVQNCSAAGHTNCWPRWATITPSFTRIISGGSKVDAREAA